MKKLLYLSLLILSLSSCVKNNPDPSWIQVNNWTLEANIENIGVEGELTHNFSDAWVYVNDEFMGVFEVPFKIPVLKSGNCNIKIYPTVRNNGISATKKIYPFVSRYEINTELVQNQVLTINPTTQYLSGLNFWIEDFEDPSTKFETDPNSAATLFQGTDPSILKWGNSYGQVNLNPIDSTWITYSSDPNNLYLPKGQEVYLEVDYYNTNAIVTGLVAISSSSIVTNTNIQMNPQDPSTVKWKKIYIDLKEIVSNSTGAEYFKQSFQAALDEGDSEGVIILDNIKIIHF
jgi:hypothetical protein